MDTFDALHVISDFHLGGAPEHQVFDQGEALARLIRTLATEDAGQQVGLVINGDLVDFPAALTSGALQASKARAALKHLLHEDAGLAPVLEALRKFLRKPRRVLVLVLGHADLELMLPGVRDDLLERLCGDDAAARGRVRLAFDGNGYAASVGGRKVLCIHGDETDDWNAADHEALRLQARAVLREHPAPRWRASPGTLLNTTVLPTVRREYAFASLLQPANAGLLPLLQTLSDRFQPLLHRFARELEREREDPSGLNALYPSERGRTALRRNRDFELGPRGLRAQAVLDHRNKRVADLEEQDLRPSQRPALLGPSPFRRALAGFFPESPETRLRRKDSIFGVLDSQLGRDIAFIVAGHTHQERAIPRSEAEGVYFNSGTWTGLLDVPEERRAQAGPEDLEEALAQQSLAELKAAGLIQYRRTVVSIYVQGEQVHGELRHAAAKDAPGAPWTSVRGSLHRLDRRTP